MQHHSDQPTVDSAVDFVAAGKAAELFGPASRRSRYESVELRELAVLLLGASSGAFGGTGRGHSPQNPLVFSVLAVGRVEARLLTWIVAVVVVTDAAAVQVRLVVRFFA